MQRVGRSHRHVSDATCCSVLKGCSGIKRGDAAELAAQSHDFTFFFLEEIL